MAIDTWVEALVSIWRVFASLFFASFFFCVVWVFCFTQEKLLAVKPPDGEEEEEDGYIKDKQLQWQSVGLGLCPLQVRNSLS